MRARSEGGGAAYGNGDPQRDERERRGARRGRELSTVRERLTRRTRGRFVIGVVRRSREPRTVRRGEECDAVIARLPGVHVRHERLHDERGGREGRDDHATTGTKGLHVAVPTGRE